MRLHEHFGESSELCQVRRILSACHLKTFAKGSRTDYNDLRTVQERSTFRKKIWNIHDQTLCVIVAPGKPLCDVRFLRFWWIWRNLFNPHITLMSIMITKSTRSFADPARQRKPQEGRPTSHLPKRYNFFDKHHFWYQRHRTFDVHEPEWRLRLDCPRMIFGSFDVQSHRWATCF